MDVQFLFMNSNIYIHCYPGLLLDVAFKRIFSITFIKFSDALIISKPRTLLIYKTALWKNPQQLDIPESS